MPVCVSRLLELRGFSQRELARRSGFTVAVVGDILSGQRCSVASLQALTKHLAEDEAERYNLICAHLRDEVVRAGCDPTHVVIRHAEGADLGALDLTPEMNAFIGTLAREAEVDDNVADVIEGLSDILVERAALRADLKARVIPFPSVEKKETQPKPGRPRSTPPIPKPDATG
jgi:transcriptional regulator with XRE-family HTH domain